MKILYIAFACNPYVGSEAFCGWSWPLAMRKYCEVYVVTRKENRIGIEKYLDENRINDIEFFYYDIPDAFNLYYKFGKMYMPYSILWQNTSYGFIKELHEKYNFDYIHQVTLGDFRLVNPAWKLNSKFIFGPVGGAQLTPESLKSYIGDDDRSERKREWINRMIKSWPFYRRALNRTYLIFAANPETQIYLQDCLDEPEKCKLLTENGVNADQIHGISEKTDNDKVVLLWSGRMIKRKGLSFLLDVLRLVKTKKPYILKLVGEGPEMNNLKKQASILKLMEKVEFVGKVSYEEMQHLYLASDIFVFPSLRETTGTVLFEAMANKLPIVTFDQNGAALLVNKSCGRKVNVNQPVDDIRAEFADYIRELIEDDALRIKMGEGAYNQIFKEYLWETKCKSFFDTYLKEG